MSSILSRSICLRFCVAVLGAAWLVSLAGCGSGLAFAGGAAKPNGNGLATGGAGSIYVLQSVSNGGTFVSSSLLQFAVNSSENAVPTATLNAPAGVVFYSVATDSAGTIYVGAYPRATMQMEILVYPAGSTGNATPVRTLIGEPYDFTYSLAHPTPTTFCLPFKISVGADGTLYVLSTDIMSNESIVMFPAGASGAVTPKRMIMGAGTGIIDPEDVAVDGSGNVYVTDLQATNGSVGTILEYAPGSTGNAVPVRVITNPEILTGVAVDGSGNLYAQANPAVGYGPGAIVEYAAGADSMATPVKTISGGATEIYGGGGLRVDAAGNLYMENLTPAGNFVTFSILAFSPSANGNVTPNVSLSSSQWDTDGGLALH